MASFARLSLELDPKTAGLLLCIWLAVCWASFVALRSRKHVSESTPVGPSLFQTPLPVALEKFDLDATDPQLYRPMRHGPNHVTMGIRKLDWNHWIELDSNYLRYHNLKVQELNKDFGAHVDFVDNATTRDACFEMLEELTRFLTHRFPRIFRLDGRTLHNAVTGESFPYPAGMSPLQSWSREWLVMLTEVLQQLLLKHYLPPRSWFRTILC